MSLRIKLFSVEYSKEIENVNYCLEVTNFMLRSYFNTNN
jgi:hypothetical protein